MPLNPPVGYFAVTTPVVRRRSARPAGWSPGALDLGDGVPLGSGGCSGWSGLPVDRGRRPRAEVRGVDVGVDACSAARRRGDCRCRVPRCSRTRCGAVPRGRRSWRCLCRPGGGSMAVIPLASRRPVASARGELVSRGGRGTVVVPPLPPRAPSRGSTLRGCTDPINGLAEEAGSRCRTGVLHRQAPDAAGFRVVGL